MNHGILDFLGDFKISKLFFLCHIFVIFCTSVSGALASNQAWLVQNLMKNLSGLAVVKTLTLST